MLNTVLLDFARWLAAKPFSIDLRESLYLFSGLETAHVLTLTLSLGMLFVIDARMLGRSDSLRTLHRIRLVRLREADAGIHELGERLYRDDSITVTLP